MYGSCLFNEYIKGLNAFINFTKKNMLHNARGNICSPCKYCKNKKKYHGYDMLRSHLIRHGFMEDYRYWNKHGEKELTEVEMRDSYLERKDPTGVEEDHDDVNEIDILGFTSNDTEFQVHNIEELVRDVKRHGYDDQYSNDKLAKYKKMIEDSKKSFYHGCATQYMRLFVMVKFLESS
jgi:hypothetical protein